MYISFKDTFNNFKKSVSKECINTLMSLQGEEIYNELVDENIINNNIEFSIQVEFDNIKKNINMLKKYDNDNNLIFYSKKDSPINIVYILNELIENIDLYLNIDLSLCEGIGECIEILMIYKEFLKGKLKILGEVIVNESDDADIENIDSLISIYSKIKIIFDYLEINDIKIKTLSCEEIKNIEIIYESLIKNKIYKEYVIKDIKITSLEKIDISDLLYEDNVKVIFLSQDEFIILDKVVSLPSIICVCNVDKDNISYIKNKDKYEYIINMNEKVYKLHKYFKNMDDMNHYIKDIDIYLDMNNSDYILKGS